MEGLNNMIMTTKLNRWPRGFDVARTGGGSIEITHLQYANDTLILYDSDEDKFKPLRVIFWCFLKGFMVYTLTRGKASYTLLMLCKIWRTLNAILGGEIGDLPSIYLGIPLGAKFLPSELWNSVIKKCGKKLARWKTRLNKIRRKFLWQGNSEMKGYNFSDSWKETRGIRNQESENSECFFCGETAETVNYLFLHCKVTEQLWRIFLNLEGILWTMPGKITNNPELGGWEEAGVQRKAEING
ncbi:hypothetical protein MTR67_012904 [Solanum verrucosum]|uniref:Reverse transcriptase zinc-binding domain-containing protein n=1 Tax=Solanum verrucosum TaxID=315347 RepID=A0AAF0QGJ0_SOLVR|nr:hypothetical protein MTR67_012904 [Solanum verrucosum]